MTMRATRTKRRADFRHTPRVCTSLLRACSLQDPTAVGEAGRNIPSGSSALCTCSAAMPRSSLLADHSRLL